MTHMLPENIPPNRFSRLIDGFAAHLHSPGRGGRENMERLLQGFRPMWMKTQEERQRTAPRFNVFEALAVRDKETLHSRFLAFLLDPAGSHDQGDMFLRPFLGLALNEPDLRTDKHSVVVRTEMPVGEKGRIDLYIRVPGRIIVVENKVHALERNDQLSDYRDWLASRKVKGTLVFLTPDGRKPISGEACRCLSYGDIAGLLDGVTRQMREHGLKLVLGQYAGICRDLHRSYGDEPDERGYSSLLDGSR